MSRLAFERRWLPPFHDGRDDIGSEIADPHHVSEITTTLPQPRSDLYQRSRLVEHRLANRMRLRDQSDQSAIAVGRDGLRTVKYELHHLTAGKALDRETQQMEGFILWNQRGQANRDVDMVIMQIDAINQALQQGVLTRD